MQTYRVLMTLWAVFMFTACTVSFVFLTRGFWRDAYDAIEHHYVSPPVGRVMAVVLVLCSVMIHGGGYVLLAGLMFSLWGLEAGAGGGG